MLAAQTERSQRNRLSIYRRSFIKECIEILVGVGIVVGLGWFIPLSWEPSQILFCALFLIVCAIAVRYRAMSGYLSGLLAASCFLGEIWVRSEGSFAAITALPMLVEAFLLFASGIFVSDLFHVQRRRCVALEQKCTALEETVQKVQQRYQHSVKINEALEREASGQPFSVATISEQMTQLWNYHGGERRNAITRMIAQALYTQSCALYVQNGEHFTLAAYCGSQSEDNVYAEPAVPIVLEPDHPLLRGVLQRLQVCTIRDVFFAEQPHKDAGIMMGPLLNQKQDLLGVVLIHDMPLLKFTPGALKLFTALLHLSSIALEQDHSEQVIAPATLPDSSPAVLEALSVSVLEDLPVSCAGEL